MARDRQISTYLDDDLWQRFVELRDRLRRAHPQADWTISKTLRYAVEVATQAPEAP